jgi:tetratricopeptide (TPR) repeat protein
MLSAGMWFFYPAAGTPAAMREQAARQRPANKTDRLIESYQQLLRDEPDYLEAYAILGNAYVQKARESGDPSYYSKAVGIFDGALQRDPNNVEALIGKGQLALAQHQFRLALALGERARVLNPHVPRIYGVIGDAQVELGMYSEAVETIQTMVDMRPDLSSYSRVAYLRELHGDTAGAIEAMERAVRAGGPTSENTAWTWVQLGNLHFSRGDLARAEAQYASALERLPGYVYGLAGLARVRAAEGKTDEARSLYNQAIAQVPLPEFVIALGELEQATGNNEAATRQFGLVRAMQQLFAAQGTNTDLELALFESDHGDAATALRLARAAYTERPSIKGAEALAWALYKNGQLAEASKYMDEALRLGTSDATLHYRAAVIAQASGDEASAREHARQALAINPHVSPLYGPQLQSMAR